MRPILRRATIDGEPPSQARRVASIALTVAAHLLLAWLLSLIAPRLGQREPTDTLQTFDIAPGTRAVRDRPAATATARRRSAGAPPDAMAAPTPVPVPVPVPTPSVDLSLFGDRALASAADLSRLPARGRGGDAEGDDVGDSVASYGPGEGPGGQPLYNARWQREPSDAELRGYLANGAPPDAWALIACRTIPDYQVDNCRILGESPTGLGLAKAMRQAAWQFRILPPRRGGKALVGAWVRIRFDFGRRPAD